MSNSNNVFRRVFRGSSKRVKIAAAVGAALVVVLVGGWFVYTMLDDKPTSSDNPVVNQYREKLPALEKAAKKNQNDTTAQRDYAVALYATGDTKKAKVYYEKAVRLSGNDATLHNNLGNVYRDLGEIDRAVVEYRKASELNPKLINPYVNLANVQLYSQNKPDEAIVTYRAALRSMPDNDQIRLLLGLALEQKGNRSAAKQVYEAILAADAENAAARANLDRLNKDR